MPCLTGKSSEMGPFSIAMFVYWRVCGDVGNPQMGLHGYIEVAEGFCGIVIVANRQLQAIVTDFQSPKAS